MSAKPVGSAVEPCPGQKSTILIQVQRADTKQALGDAMVKLDGPTPCGGKTGAANGIVLFDPVKPGSYRSEIDLPANQAAKFEKPQPRAFGVAGGEDKVVLVEVARAMHWIGISLVDEERRPVPNARYRITLPDGTVREGRLSSGGTARLENIEPGNCQITFPDFDRESWKPVS